MLAIAVLIGLVLWLLITLIATLVGAKMGKGLYKDNPKARLYGALTGFMLTMGAPISYWVIEYVYIQAKVSQLCESEGGITVYVTPEEYKNRLAINKFSDLNSYESVIDNEYKGEALKQHVVFEGVEYNWRKNDTDNILILSGSVTQTTPYIKDFYSVIYDKETKIVLSKLVMFSVGNSLKFWLDNINDCYLHSLQKERFNLKNEYINLLNGEKNEQYK
jgi:hypothetical protein